MKMRTIALAMAVAATAACLLSACGKGEGTNPGTAGEGGAGSSISQDSKSEKKKITFVLDWTPNTNHTGIYVAREKGYYEEAGLEVEIVQPPEGGATSLVASGKAQFGIDAQDTMAPALASKSPLPVSAVAALIQHNTSGIISRKGEGMDTPKGLEGKTYATWDNPVEQAMIRNVMENEGADYDKLKLIPNNIVDEVTALNTNQADAIWVFYAWSGIATEVKQLETDYFAFSDLNPVFDYYTPVIVAGNDFLETDPETAKAFLAATAKGYEDAIQNPEEAARILCEAAPELDQDIVLASQKWLADKYKAEESRWGYIDPERWNAFYTWLGDNGLVETPLPENTGFTNEYLPE